MASFAEVMMRPPAVRSAYVLVVKDAPTGGTQLRAHRLMTQSDVELGLRRDCALEVADAVDNANERVLTQHTACEPNSPSC